MSLLLALQDPEDAIAALEQILGFVIAILTQFGIYNWVVGAMFGMIVIGLTFRLIDAIGGKG